MGPRGRLVGGRARRHGRERRACGVVPLGPQVLFYSLIARGKTVLAEYTARSGNFPTVTRLLLSEIGGGDNKMSVVYDRCVGGGAFPARCLGSPLPQSLCPEGGAVPAAGACPGLRSRRGPAHPHTSGHTAFEARRCACAVARGMRWRVVRLRVGTCAGASAGGAHLPFPASAAQSPRPAAVPARAAACPAPAPLALDCVGVRMCRWGGVLPLCDMCTGHRYAGGGGGSSGRTHPTHQTVVCPPRALPPPQAPPPLFQSLFTIAGDVCDGR